MSVIYCKQVSDGRSADRDASKQRRQYTTTYIVQTDSPTVEMAEVLAHSELPQDGYTYSSDPFAIVKYRKADQHSDSKTVWTVEIKYDTDFDQQFLSENPLDRPAIYKFNARQDKEALVKDLDDPAKTIVNSAGQPYLPPLERETFYTTFTIEKNVRLKDAVDVYDPQIINCVNDGSFATRYYTYQSGTVKCTNVVMEEIYEKAFAGFVTGTVSNGDDTVTSVSDMTIIDVGSSVQGTFIPANAKVSSMSFSSFDMTVLATGSATETIAIYDQMYVKITYSFEVANCDPPESPSLEPDFNYWTPRRIIDQGMAFYNDDDQLVQATDDQGRPMSHQVLLDGDGYKLAASLDPYYLEYEVNYYADFSGVPIE